MPIVRDGGFVGVEELVHEPRQPGDECTEHHESDGQAPDRAPSRARASLSPSRADRRGGRGWGGERARRLLESGGHPDIRASAR